MTPGLPHILPARTNSHTIAEDRIEFAVCLLGVAAGENFDRISCLDLFAIILAQLGIKSEKEPVTQAVSYTCTYYEGNFDFLEIIVLIDRIAGSRVDQAV